MIGQYAHTHGLAYESEGTLPDATPLLSRGDRRFATDLASGEFPGGLDGTLAHYTYVVTDNGSERRYRYTTFVTYVAESLGFVRFLLCRHRSGARTADDARGLGIPKKRRFALESAVVAEHYRIETSDEEDEVWLRELFQPSFVAWLADRAPEELSFELVDGVLCVSVSGHDHEPARLERLVEAATRIAERLRGEAVEDEGRAPIAITARAAERAARLRAKLDRVQWPTPPPDARTATRAYLRTAAAEPGPWARALLTGTFLAVAAYVEYSDGDLVEAAAIGVGMLLLTAYALIRRAAARYGQEAFVREYARSRGLALEDGRRFHSDHVRLPLPGVASHALRGRFGEAELEAELVLLSDRRHSYRPVHWNLLATRMPGGEASAAELQAGEYYLTRQEDDVLVFRRGRSPADRSAHALDRFSDEAARIAAELGS